MASAVESIPDLASLAEFIVAHFSDDKRIFSHNTVNLDCRFPTRYFKTTHGSSVMLSLKLKTVIHTSLPKCIEYLTRGTGVRRKNHEDILRSDLIKYPIKEIKSPVSRESFVNTSQSQLSNIPTSIVRRVFPSPLTGDLETCFKYKVYENSTMTRETIVSFESDEEDEIKGEEEGKNVEVDFSLCGPRRLINSLGCYKLQQLSDGSTRIVLYLRLNSAKEIGTVAPVLTKPMSHSNADSGYSSFRKKRGGGDSFRSSKSEHVEEINLVSAKSKKFRVNKKVTQEMILVGCAQHLVEMWDYFANSEVIDAARDQQFIDSIPDAVTLNDKELVLIRSMYRATEPPVETKDTLFGFEGWVFTQGSLTPGSIKKFERYFVNNSDPSKQESEKWGMAKAIVDVAPEKILAELRNWDSNANTMAYIQAEGSAGRQCVNVPGTRSFLTREYTKSGIMKTKAIETWFTWAEVLHHDGTLSYVFAFTPKDNYDKVKKAAAAREDRGQGFRRKSVLEEFLDDDEEDNVEKQYEENAPPTNGEGNSGSRSDSWSRRFSSIVSPSNKRDSTGRRETSTQEIMNAPSHLDSLGLASDRMSMFDSEQDKDEGSGSGGTATGRKALRRGLHFGQSFGHGQRHDEAGTKRREIRKGVYLLKKLAPNVTNLTLVSNDDAYAYGTAESLVKAHQRDAYEVDIEVVNFRAELFARREAEIYKVKQNKIDRVNKTVTSSSLNAPAAEIRQEMNGMNGEEGKNESNGTDTMRSNASNNSQSTEVGASFRGPIKVTPPKGAHAYLDENSERQARLGLSWEAKGQHHADKVQVAKDKWRMNHRHISTSPAHLKQLQHLLWLYVATLDKELTSRNQKTMQKCLGIGRRKWKRCKSLNPHVQHFETTQRLTAQTHFDKAVVEVDATPAGALSCLLNAESNGQITRIKEDPNDKAMFLNVPRKVKLKPGTYDEQVLIRVRAAYMSKRTFACRRVYSKLPSQIPTYILAFESVEPGSGYRIDFGYDLSFARSRNATLSGYYLIEQMPPGKSSVIRSKVTLIQAQNLKGRGLGMPKYVQDAIKIDPVKELDYLRSRSADLDQEVLSSTVDAMQRNGIGDAEKAEAFDMLEKDLCVGTNWDARVLRATSLAKVEEHNHTPSLSHGEIIVQANIEEVAAWIFMAESRERMEMYRKSDLYGVAKLEVSDLHYNVRELNDNNHIFQHLVCHKRRNYYMSLKRCFRKLGDGVIEIAETDCEDSFIDMKLLKFSRIKTKSLFKVTKHDSLVNGTPQAKVDFWCSHEGASLLLNFSVKRVSSELSLINDKFSRPFAIDAAHRQVFIDDVFLDPFLMGLTEAEEKLVEDAMLMEKSFSKNPDIWHHGYRSALSEERLGCNKSLMGKFGGHDHALWGKSTSFVKASMEQVLGFLWDFTSHEFLDQYTQEHERTVVQEVSPHTHIVFKKCDGGLDFLSKRTWKIIDQDNIVIGIEPTEHQSKSQRRCSSIGQLALDGLQQITVSRGKSKYLDSKPTFRAKEWSLLKLTRLSQTEVKIVVVTKLLMPPQSIPTNRSALQREVVERTISTSVITRKYFKKVLPIEQHRAEEGQALGHIICDTLVKEVDFWGTNHEAVVRSVIKDYKGLREVAGSYPWFPTLLAEASKTRLRGLAEVNTNLTRLSNFEARLIGCSLSSSLRARKTAESGLDQWRLNYPSMVEFCERQQFAESMFLIVAKHVLRKAIWGLQWRVAIGAVLSFIDILTDIFMITVYIKEGNSSLAYLNISMISINLLLQAILVTFQNWKKPKTIPAELVSVFTGMKPAMDAHRVASGTEREPYQRLDPLAELTATKLAEMVAEAIPAAILQTYAFLNDGSGGTAAVFSILISSSATAYMSSIISFDFDCDPENRSSYGEFYGYVPDSSSSRSLTFGAMMVYSACTNLTRVIGSALLLTYSSMLFIFVLGFDMFLFFVYKAVRQDLTHWIPSSGVWKVVTTMTARFATKLISDYTGIAQLRHPHELGPVYWLGMIIFNQAWGWIAFGSVTVVFEVKSNFDLNTMIGTLALLNVLFFAGLSTFYFSCKKEYRGTFMSTERGFDYSRKLFLEGGKNHAKRMTIFSINKAHWKDLKRPVNRFVRTNWQKWKDSKVEWLTDDLILSLPTEFIPKQEQSLIRENKERFKRKRRSSMGKIVGLEVWNRRESNYLLGGSFADKIEQVQIKHQTHANTTNKDEGGDSSGKEYGAEGEISALSDNSGDGGELSNAEEMELNASIDQLVAQSGGRNKVYPEG
ncbi:hypothetical protein TrLO_g9456 [Triparma laevis f. longispina]|uniref:Uncharacterized protein n=1 Tax=Triparma laevis f. longispina TaxID=1714387 RepID=A0A9W7AW93_9STRA|nr:hypothetical protein TrLO_g9456 [Triparma laevis f. longispina]